MDRVETGPLQFERDWPGVFIRGDQALYFGVTLKALASGMPESEDDMLAVIHKKTIDGLGDLLMSCNVHASSAINLTTVQRADILRLILLRDALTACRSSVTIDPEGVDRKLADIIADLDGLLAPA
ncbi:hypothetical protein [Hyphomicrobium sp.]|uniref:hypothetical protein n=1 Tax=Hyphomicrobium sp. TaxID=82 RepID=UPI001D6CD508|nr:hypothetical protein [Hyphomicrobium sp.]MBY0561550.1 hypothetical protein [Hyphomicrobium sp.]